MVGSGPAGCAVAARLSEDPGRRVTFPRGKVLGGCSSTSAHMYVRGHRLDYDGWELETGTTTSCCRCSGAPRTTRARRQVPRRRRPCHVSDLRDPNPLSLAFIEAAAEIGIARNHDFNGEELDGVGLVQVSQRAGRRFSAADGDLRPARANLDVLTGAHATRILLEGGRAVGRRVRARGCATRGPG